MQHLQVQQRTKREKLIQTDLNLKRKETFASLLVLAIDPFPVCKPAPLLHRCKDVRDLSRSTYNGTTKRLSRYSSPMKNVTHRIFPQFVLDPRQ